jgi:hypothetical protein
MSTARATDEQDRAAVLAAFRAHCAAMVDGDTRALSRPHLVVMPDLVGLNAAVASDKLQKLGFTKIQYGSQDAEDKVVLLLTNWTVTKQSTKTMLALSSSGTMSGGSSAPPGAGTSVSAVTGAASAGQSVGKVTPGEFGRGESWPRR